MNHTLSREEAKSIPHLGSEILFCPKPIKYDSYFGVREKIQSSGLLVPTLSEVISLIDYAWKNAKDLFSKEVISSSAGEEGIWGYTGILILPNEGIYVEDNPEIEKGIEVNRIIKMHKDDLERRLAFKDQKVRFVPWGQNLVSRYSEDKFMHAFVGIEGAQKLEEIGATHYGLPRASFRMENHYSYLTQPRRYYPSYNKRGIGFYPQGAGEDDCPAVGFGIFPKL